MNKYFMIAVVLWIVYYFVSVEVRSFMTFLIVVGIALNQLQIYENSKK